MHQLTNSTKLYCVQMTDGHRLLRGQAMIGENLAAGRKMAFHIALFMGQEIAVWYHLRRQDTFECLARIENWTGRRLQTRDSGGCRRHRGILQTQPRKRAGGGEPYAICERAAALLHQP